MAEVIRNTFPELSQLASVINADRAARVSTNVHRDAGDYTIGFATLSGTDAAAQQAAIDAANEMMYKYLLHIRDISLTPASDGSVGVAHKGAWAVPSLTKATSVGTAQTLANAIQTDYTSHIADTTAHDNADGTNTWTTTAASNLATLQTLLNAGKGKLNAHFAAALGGRSIRITPA